MLTDKWKKVITVEEFFSSRINNIDNNLLKRVVNVNNFIRYLHSINILIKNN